MPEDVTYQQLREKKLVGASGPEPDPVLILIANKLARNELAGRNQSVIGVAAEFGDKYANSGGFRKRARTYAEAIMTYHSDQEAEGEAEESRGLMTHLPVVIKPLARRATEQQSTLQVAAVEIVVAATSAVMALSSVAVVSHVARLARAYLVPTAIPSTSTMEENVGYPGTPTDSPPASPLPSPPGTPSPSRPASPPNVPPPSPPVLPPPSATPLLGTPSCPALSPDLSTATPSSSAGGHPYPGSGAPSADASSPSPADGLYHPYSAAPSGDPPEVGGGFPLTLEATNEYVRQLEQKLGEASEAKRVMVTGNVRRQVDHDRGIADLMLRNDMLTGRMDAERAVHAETVETKQALRSEASKQAMIIQAQQMDVDELKVKVELLRRQTVMQNTDVAEAREALAKSVAKESGGREVGEELSSARKAVTDLRQAAEQADERSTSDARLRDEQLAAAHRGREEAEGEADRAMADCVKAEFERDTLQAEAGEMRERILDLQALRPGDRHAWGSPPVGDEPQWHEAGSRLGCRASQSTMATATRTGRMPRLHQEASGGASSHKRSSRSPTPREMVSMRQRSRSPMVQDGSAGLPTPRRKLPATVDTSRSSPQRRLQPFQREEGAPVVTFATLWEGLPQSDRNRSELKALLKNETYPLKNPELDASLKFVDSYLIDPYLDELLDDVGFPPATDALYADAALYRALRMRALQRSRLQSRNVPRSLGQLGDMLSDHLSVCDDDADVVSLAPSSYLELPVPPAALLSSQCSDSAWAMQVVRCDVFDHSGNERLHRAFFTVSAHTKRESYARREHKDAVKYAREIGERLAIPKDLSSADQAKSAAAWSVFRAQFANEILLCLRHGAEWMLILTTLAARLARPATSNDRTTGHNRLYGFIRTAINDLPLHDIPLLHADALFFKMDRSFEGAVKSSANTDWDNCLQRSSTLDANAVAQRLLDAFIKMKRDPSLTAENVWFNEIDRNILFERFHLCLTNDVDDPARGQYSAGKFNQDWLMVEAQVAAGETDPSELDIRKFALRRIGPLESALQRNRDLKAKKPGAPVIPRPAAAASRNEFDEFVEEDVEVLGSAPAIVPGKGGGRGGRTRFPLRTAAAAAPKPTVAPVGMTTRAAAAAIHRDATGTAPDPRDATRPTFPSAGRTATMPTGKTGEPTDAEWTEQKWTDVTIEWGQLAGAVVEGVKSWAYPCAARARPDDSSMKVLRTDPERPSSDSQRVWPDDACSYCHYRPKATGAEAAVGHARAWFFGTGDGKHNPYRCKCFKRFLAEGGEPTNTAREKQFLRSALQYRERSWVRKQ